MRRQIRGALVPTLLLVALQVVGCATVRTVRTTTETVESWSELPPVTGTVLQWDSADDGFHVMLTTERHCSTQRMQIIDTYRFEEREVSDLGWPIAILATSATVSLVGAGTDTGGG